MLPSQFRKLRELLSSQLEAINIRVGAIEEALREQVAAKEQENNASDQAREDERRGWIISTIKDRYTRYGNQRQENYRTNKNIRQQIILNYLTFFAVAGAWLYAGIAAFQGWEMIRATRAAEKASETTAKQFAMYKQQTEYTESAKVIVEPTIIFPTTDRQQEIDLLFFSAGRERVSKLKAYFTLTEKPVDGKGKVRSYAPLATTSHDLLPIQDNSVSAGEGLFNRDPHRDEKHWPTSLSQGDVKRIWNTTDYLELDYEISYCNGFKPFAENVKLCYIASVPGWQKSAPDGGFISCDNLQIGLNALRERRKQEEEYHKTHP